MKTTMTYLRFALAILVLITLSCNLLSQDSSPSVQVATSEPEVVQPTKMVEPAEPVTEKPSVDEPDVQVAVVVQSIRQWAASARASSEYSNPDWAAHQATGAPDTLDCGDYETAWASVEGDSVDWLEVHYDTPVFPTEVNIYESHTPSQVVKVELIDTAGAYHPLYTATPEMKIDCPFLLTIPVNDANFQVAGVKITVDQSVLELPWDEIDAVELVGTIEGEEQTPVQVSPSPDTPVQAPVSDITIPDGLLWLVNEDSLGMELGTFGDIAASNDGRVYVPDNRNGVLVFDMQGNLLSSFEYDGFVNPADVKIGPDGNIYVADWGADGILIFSPEGEFISRFGENGRGPGQFGDFGPKSFAIGPDNSIYTIDDNRDENNNPFMRLMMFTKEGDYLGETPIDLSSLFPVGMEFGPDGYLYIVNYRRSNVQKWDSTGNYVADVGGEALKGSDPQYLAFDAAGYMYMTIWEEPGVIILDPAGNFVGRFGYEEDPDLSPWADGAMNKPTGIAVTADGSRIIFSDYANMQPILEALKVR